MKGWHMSFNLVQEENTFDKFRVEASEIKTALKSLRDDALYDFDILNTIIAVDLGIDQELQSMPDFNLKSRLGLPTQQQKNDCALIKTRDKIGQFELIYDLHSTKTGNSKQISVLIDRNSPKIESVVDIYKSAYFDECEIYDMFGITFDNNPNLKRLLMPKGWIGHPLRKDYEQKDERLYWSEK